MRDYTVESFYISFLRRLFQYIAEKVHCVWLSDGELQVLFKCKGTGSNPDFLSMHIKYKAV